MESTPKLIETSARNYLYYTLKECHGNRINVYYYALNIGVFILFVGTAILVLYYCSHRKMSEYDKQQKMLRDQEYVLSKIRFYQEIQDSKQQSYASDITNLPFIPAKI